MPTAAINGTDVYYEVAGDGLPCIALHGGLGMDHTYLKTTLAPLHDVMRFIYVDQRGNGRSARPPLETITLSQLAADVDALRAHLGLEQIGLLGHSFGGFVALEYAVNHAERLSRLLLVDTSPGNFTPTEEELAERPDPSTVSPESVEATRRLFSGAPSSHEEYAQHIRDVAVAYTRSVPPSKLVSIFAETIFDVQAMYQGFASFTGWSVADDLHRIACPTLIMCGRYDLQTTPECSKRLASSIPNASLVWFEESGHFPVLEQPAAVHAAIRSWLSEAH